MRAALAAQDSRASRSAGRSISWRRARLASGTADTPSRRGIGSACRIPGSSASTARTGPPPAPALGPGRRLGIVPWPRAQEGGACTGSNARGRCIRPGRRSLVAVSPSAATPVDEELLLIETSWPGMTIDGDPGIVSEGSSDPTTINPEEPGLQRRHAGVGPRRGRGSVVCTRLTGVEWLVGAAAQESPLVLLGLSASSISDFRPLRAVTYDGDRQAVRHLSAVVSAVNAEFCDERQR